MEKSALHSAHLTHSLFYYGIVATLISSILAFLPNVIIFDIGNFLLNVISFILILVGSVLAYAYRKQARPPLLSHYQYLITTLWIMVALSLITMGLSGYDSIQSMNTTLATALNGGSLSAMHRTPWLTVSSNVLTLIFNVYFLARILKARRLLRLGASMPHSWWL